MTLIHIVSILCFSFCLVVFFYLKWYVKKRTAGTTIDERRTEFLKLIADIDSITDRDTRLVEERINKLNEILEETDKRINLLMKELDKSRGAETLYTSLGRGIRDALYQPNKESLETKTANNEYPVDTIELFSNSNVKQNQSNTKNDDTKLYNQNGFSRLPLFEMPEYTMQQDIPVQTSPASPVGLATPVSLATPVGLAKPVQPAAPVQPVSKKQLRSQIDLLISEGLSIQEIASRLNISIGEVELAFNLRRH